MMKRVCKNIWAGAAVIAVGLGLTGAAHSGMVSLAIDENSDCSGYFSTGAGECHIYDVEGDGEFVSPWVIKFGDPTFEDTDSDVNWDEIEINEIFDEGIAGTISGDEFAFSGFDFKSGELEILGGNWSYTPDDPEDPAIRFWTTKSGGQNSGGLNLQFVVPNDSTACDAVASWDDITTECLNAAVSRTAGGFGVAEGTTQGVSHVVFWDTENGHKVPEPAALGLFGIGLAGLGFAARRRRKA